jgi:hypothetical protein
MKGRSVQYNYNLGPFECTKPLAIDLVDQQNNCKILGKNFKHFYRVLLIENFKLFWLNILTLQGVYITQKKL